MFNKSHMDSIQHYYSSSGEALLMYLGIHIFLGLRPAILSAPYALPNLLNI